MLLLRSLRSARLALLVLVAFCGTAVAQDYGSRSEIPDEPCFGAAARDPKEPCRNKNLRLRVFPKPAQAVLELNSPCSLRQEGKQLSVCSFGVPEEQASLGVALIGDSHAAHLRASLEAIVAEQNWSGKSLTRTGCPYTASTTFLDDAGERRACKVWKPEVTRFLRRNPQISTIFVSQHAGVRVTVAEGEDVWREKVDGYKRMWSRLPETVRHVVVIRDVPRMTSNTLSCVERAMKARKPAAPACAVPRRFSVQRDPAVVAAREMRSERVQSIDLSNYICSARMCFPVVGGALVHKDTGHLTQVFARTLGPYLQRAVRRLMTRWDKPQEPAGDDAGGVAPGDPPPSGGGGTSAPDP